MIDYQDREPSGDVMNSNSRVIEAIEELRECVSQWRRENRTIGLVPTMGALHAGHRSLIDAARSECEAVVVSIFVNPTQFGPTEDFSRYPRTFESDRAMCAEAGVDLIFLPSAEAIYPPGFATFVEVGRISDRLEGAARPGHFRGVATVVLKLFELVRPDVAYFGAKDYQQQLLIRRMTRDLDLPIRIETRPTLREADGLAMSSRNRYLSDSERTRARAISAALFTGRDRLRSGERDLDAIRREMRQIMEDGGLEVDYAAICDIETLEELSSIQPRMALLIAARLGSVRLIDNLEVMLDSEAENTSDM